MDGMMGVIVQRCTTEGIVVLLCQLSQFSKLNKENVGGNIFTVYK